MIVISPEMDVPAALREAWTALPRTRHPLVPAHSDLKLTALRAVMPYILLFQHRGDGNVAAHMVGAHIKDILGLDQDTPITGDYHPVSFEGIAQQRHLVRRMLETPCGLNTTRRLRHDTALAGHILLDMHILPLADRNGDVTRGVAAMDFRDSAGNRHPWVPVDPRKLDPELADHRFIDIGGGLPAERIDP
ncbi:PAS domain-containing protein [Yunchengibacter salinarum]|uniref:PAS domain-containing protein n=1 Tax=Yunchengibacter salinarum TaxID=3133399 RepID=UPI0035B6A9A8